MYEYLRIRWQWKITNVYAKGNARTKSGDDYPIRIYVMFEYDPDNAGLLDRMKYGLAKRRLVNILRTAALVTSGPAALSRTGSWPAPIGKGENGITGKGINQNRTMAG